MAALTTSSGYAAYSYQSRWAAGYYPPANVYGKNEHMVFNHVVVPLDGQAYNDDTFNNVIFTWSGTAPIMIMKSHFEGISSIHTPNVMELLDPYMREWTDPHDPYKGSSPNDPSDNDDQNDDQPTLPPNHTPEYERQYHVVSVVDTIIGKNADMTVVATPWPTATPNMCEKVATLHRMVAELDAKLAKAGIKCP